jgi:ankyrin repeat protein
MNTILNILCIFIFCGISLLSQAMEEKDILSPLIKSSMTGDLSEVKTVIEKNENNIDETDRKNKTALIHASTKGHIPVVEYLIERKANLNHKDNDGKTALIWASDRGHVDVVKLLFPKSDPNLKDKEGKTALIWASEKGQTKVIELLLEKKTWYNRTRDTDINAKDINGMTALMGATIKGHSDIIKFLLFKKADINAKDANGYTAIFHSILKENLSILNLLIENGANINLKDGEGNTALMTAMVKENYEIAKLLLKNKADVNANGKNNVTALMIAASKNNKRLTKLLLENGAGIDEKDNDDKTAIDWARAIKKNRFAASDEIVKILEEYKTNPIISSTEDIIDVDKDIPKTNKKSPNSFALVIGNENYPNDGTVDKKKNVKGAINDAKIFKKYLVDIIGVPEHQIVLKEDANKQTFDNALKEIFSKAKLSLEKKQAILFIYYAGHGLPGKENEKEKNSVYLAPIDINLKDIAGSSISTSNIYTRIEKAGFSKVFVFLDSCFSGRDGGLQEETRDLKIELKEDELKGNIIVFSGAKSDQRAHAKKNSNHGEFTYFLLKKLGATKGEIKYSELCEQVRYEVFDNSSKEHDTTQEPECKVSDSIKEEWKEWKVNE